MSKKNRSVKAKSKRKSSGENIKSGKKKIVIAKVKSKTPVVKKSPVKSDLNNGSKGSENKLQKKTGVKKYIKISVPSYVYAFGLALAVTFFAGYIFTMPRTNVSYADSDELLTVAYNLGVAHPPGYSLYILLLHGFLQLPISGSVAFRGALLSGLLQSLGLMLIFVGNWLLVNYVMVNSKRLEVIWERKWDSVFISMVATGIIGSSYLYWIQSIVPEKYALLGLLTSLFYFLSVSALSSRYDKKIVWWVIGGVSGMMFFYHPTSLILVPMLTALIWKSEVYKNVGRLGAVVACLTLGATIAVGSLYWLNLQSSAISWSFEKNLDGLVGHLTRADFVGTAVNSGKELSYIGPVDLNKMMQTLPVYFDLLASHLGWLNLALAGLGVYVLYNYGGKLRWIVLWGIGGASLFLPLYLGIPGDPGGAFVVMRQYLMGYILLSPIIALGIWFASLRIYQGLAVIIKHKSVKFVPVLLLSLGLLSWVLYTTWPNVQLSQYNFINRYYTDVLEEMPEDAMLGCFTDTACFAMMYLQYVEGVRKDVLLVMPAYPLYEDVLSKYDDLRGFDYEKDPFLTFDYLTWSIDKRPVYVTDLPAQYYSLLGVNFGFVHYIPDSYVAELTHKIPETLPEREYDFTEEILKMETPELDLMRSWHKMIVARSHMLNGSQYLKMDMRTETIDELNKMANLLFQVPQVPHREIESTRTNIENSSPYENFALGSSSQDVKEVFKTIDFYLENKKLQQAYTGALGVIAIEPLNEQGRMKLAEIYERMGDNDFALTEYKNVLKYYPENQEALDKVERLSQ